MTNETRAAERMLQRAQALGLTTKTGTPVVVDLMEELLAAASGFRNAHAWRASLKKSVAPAAGAQEPPALELVNPKESGNDYRLLGRGCWVEVDDYLAHLYLQPDDSGFTVDLHAKSEAFDPVTSVTMTREDLKAFEARADEESIEQQQLDALEELGVEVLEDAKQPGLWVWTAPTDGCDGSFASKVEALADAWSTVGRSVCGMKNVLAAQWKVLSLQAQCDLVRQLAAS